MEGQLERALREMCESQELPDEWREFILVLLHKKKLTDLVSGKREVACMSHGAKLMERCAIQVAIDMVTSR